MPENEEPSPTTGSQPEAASEGPRPSDTEAAHAPQEGRAFSGRTDMEGRVDPPGRDRREDYGGGSMGHSLPGTDAHTAGAEFADRLPEAAKTSVEEAGTKPKP